MVIGGQLNMFDLFDEFEESLRSAEKAEETDFSEYIVTDKIGSLEKEHGYKQPVGMLGVILRAVEKRLYGSNTSGDIIEAAEKAVTMYLKKLSLLYLEENDPNAKTELDDILSWNITAPEGISKVDMTKHMSFLKKGGYPKTVYLGTQKFFNGSEYGVNVTPTGLCAFGKRHIICQDGIKMSFKDMTTMVRPAIARQIQKTMNEDSVSAVIYRKVAENLLKDYCYDERAEGYKFVVDAGIYDLDNVKEALNRIGLQNVEVIEPKTQYESVPGTEGFKTIDFRGSSSLAILFDGKMPVSLTSNRASRIDSRIIKQCLTMMAEEDMTEQRIEKHRAVTGSIATCYMDKKNVPLKTVAAMEASPLHRYFGRIEYDALVDLSLMEKLNKEIQAIIINFFDGLRTPDVAFRVRLLGKHKAIGLYWPTEKCICIDVRDPSAFVHEYMHMYDHRNGELSRAYEFYDIREHYTTLLKNWHDGQTEFARKKMRASVYDLGYYLTPTEIFARCGEMYFERIRGVSNSALGTCKGFAYPEDEQLMNLIAAYFNGFFADKGIEISNSAIPDEVRVA